MMEKILKITFNKKTSSKNLPEALRMARRLSAIIEGDAVTIDLSITEVFNLWEVVNSLLHLVDKWRSFEIFYKGRLCVVNKDYRRLFYALQDIRRCYGHMRDNPEDYTKCDQLWGCVKLTGISLELQPNYKNFYKYGRLLDEHTWQIDKARIRDEVQIEIEQKFLKACPAFPSSIVKKAVEDLPDTIELNANWEVLYEPKLDEGGLIREVPYAISFTADYRHFNWYVDNVLRNLNIDKNLN